MLLPKKRTIDIDDRLYQAAMKRAEQGGRSISELVEAALRVYLRNSLPFDLKWVTTRGELMPGIDINSRESLYGFSDNTPEGD